MDNSYSRSDARKSSSAKTCWNTTCKFIMPIIALGLLALLGLQLYFIATIVKVTAEVDTVVPIAGVVNVTEPVVTIPEVEEETVIIEKEEIVIAPKNITETIVEPVIKPANVTAPVNATELVLE